MGSARGGNGIRRDWSRPFLLVWTTGPILVAMTITYLIHSVESERYVIISFVGLLAFGALGAASVRSTALRVVLAILFIHFMIRPVHRWMRRSHEAAWREAAMLAVEKSAPGENISVVPSYAVNVVRYYLPRDRRDTAVGIDFGCGSGGVLILSGWGWMPADQISRMAACYPRLLQRLPMVEVRAR